MRLLIPLFAIALACGCASSEYRSTSAAVDADPLCASRPDRPGEPIAAGCERKEEVRFDLERKSDSKPLDFSGKPKDD